MIDFIKVGEKIAKCRKDKKISQEELANQVFVTRQLVSRWELGLGMPSIDMIIQLAKIFEISIDELLCLNDDIYLNKNNIFAGHEREYVMRLILTKKIDIDLVHVFYQFSDEERMAILKAIKIGNLKVDTDELLSRLSDGEKRFLLRNSLTKK